MKSLYVVIQASKEDIKAFGLRTEKEAMDLYLKIMKSDAFSARFMLQVEDHINTDEEIQEKIKQKLPEIMEMFSGRAMEILKEREEKKKNLDKGHLAN